MRKHLVSLLLVLSTVLLIGTTVMASVIYRATYTITENASTSYTMLPVWVASNNQWLANNDFMNSTANDTTVETLGGLVKPHLVVDNMTLTAVPVPADSQTNLYFTTGGTASATPFEIMTGVGGYITRTDVAAWETSANFSMEWGDVYLNLTGSNDTLVYKPLAYRVYDSATAELTTQILGASGVSWNNVHSADSAEGSWVTQAYSQRYVSQVRFRAWMIGPGQLRLHDIQIWNDETGVWVNPTSGVGVGWTDVVNAYDGNTGTFAFVAPGGGVYTTYITLTLGQIIHSSQVRWYMSDPSGDVTTKQLDIASVTETIQLSLAASGVSAGEHTITTSADSANLTIDIDGITENTTALGGASVPDNGNSWRLGGNAFPYFGYYSHSVGGTEISRYEPSSMIIGANLPDTVASNNGTITWGTNPAGVTVSLGGLIAKSQPELGEIVSETPTDVLPSGVGQVDFNVEPDVAGTLLTNPLRPFVTILSDTTTLTETQAWRFLGLAFVLFCFGATGQVTHWHPLITGIGTGAAIALLVVMTVFPLIALVVAILAIAAGIVFKRSPWL